MRDFNLWDSFRFGVKQWHHLLDGKAWADKLLIGDPEISK